MNTDTSSLEKSIGYVFADKSLLRMALTHSSYSNEMKAHSEKAESNERLEFFGDSLLSVITSEYIFRRHAEYAEGELTRLRAKAVCEDALASFARDMSLGDYLYLGHGEDNSGGRARASLLADATEALIAAMYIDASAAGGLEYAMKCIGKFILDRVRPLIEGENAPGDSKTRLQQFLQQSGDADFEYVTVGERGPDHMKVFTVEARLGSNVIGSGEGRTKKEAEQAAAMQALLLFGQK